MFASKKSRNFYALATRCHHCCCCCCCCCCSVPHTDRSGPRSIDPYRHLYRHPGHKYIPLVCSLPKTTYLYLPSTHPPRNRNRHIRRHTTNSSEVPRPNHSASTSTSTRTRTQGIPVASTSSSRSILRLRSLRPRFEQLDEQAPALQAESRTNHCSPSLDHFPSHIARRVVVPLSRSPPLSPRSHPALSLRCYLGSIESIAS
ncbi:hypothetical protein F4803DRAFT_455980 [Xylaria telfairii]|nr:hypothetical protein F4803DRAFT_455980 [Xylaria telfairii]